jgi:multisubunit Na+/H+ antiporter MnhC subunit
MIKFIFTLFVCSLFIIGVAILMGDSWLEVLIGLSLILSSIIIGKTRSDAFMEGAEWFYKKLPHDKGE